MREFLDALKISDPDDFAAVLAGLAKLRNGQYHREPLSKALDDGLFELRHVGKLNRLLKKAHLRRWRARAALRRTDSVRLAPRIARRLASGPF